MHWADVVAERLLERGKKHIVASGTSPSTTCAPPRISIVLTQGRATHTMQFDHLEPVPPNIVDEVVRRIRGY